MDNSPVPPRPIHIDNSKIQKGQRTDKVPADDTTKNKAPGVPRGRYKEKFQVLRERYDRVVVLHDEYERDLELANARMRNLQAENDLLLDAISLTVPATPSLMHLTRPSPTLYSHPHPASALPPHHMNGHGVSNSNGRYRPVDPHDITPSERDRDRDRDYRDIPPETPANGRL
ncbi:uncharacterized protein EDB91DRAFT_1245444 [Suillus paluster]|uniref:uncharacterized protein n=1 Tax=Suillus paluster TaxID=48578 RepID=UPI001B87F9C2|nr:uncharacterized protein EDB91DRAFT_1245444 [Suillus paluster]KAG1747989.1 hypothetical protein EDB91DRAFT_1245444 [Suillus paluster]